MPWYTFDNQRRALWRPSSSRLWFPCGSKDHNQVTRQALPHSDICLAYPQPFSYFPSWLPSDGGPSNSWYLTGPDLTLMRSCP